MNSITCFPKLFFVYCFCLFFLVFQFIYIYIYIYIFVFMSFFFCFHSLVYLFLNLVVEEYQWILSDSKSSQVSRTLLSILGELNNAVVWRVFTCHFIFKSSRPCANPLGIVPSALTTISIIVTFKFRSFFLFLFFCSLARSEY